MSVALESMRKSFLIIDGDLAGSKSMAEVLAQGDPPGSSERASVAVASSLAELASIDLSPHHLALCAMELPDGTGIDALAFLRAARPSLPVLLTASTVQPGLAREAIRAGAIDCMVKDHRFLERLALRVEACLARHSLLSETDQLQRVLGDSLVRLTDELSLLQATINQLERAAVTDELTGLGNRRHLNFACQSHWQAAAGTGRSLAFLMIDIDGFKAVNDRLGHRAGDEMLVLLASVLRDNCRHSDVVSRYGGDEFCVLMPGVSVTEARQAAERIVQAFDRSARPIAGPEARFGLSVGIAHTEIDHPGSLLSLIARADEAMYHAKRHGGNIVISGEDLLHTTAASRG